MVWLPLKEKLKKKKLLAPLDRVLDPPLWQSNFIMLLLHCCRFDFSYAVLDLADDCSIADNERRLSVSRLRVYRCALQLTLL